MSEPEASASHVRRAVLRGVLGALLLGVGARLALEVQLFALASSAFALLYFHTLPAGALPWIAAVVGAWLLPASLIEDRVWGKLRPGAVVLLGVLVAALGILVATAQGTYTHTLITEGVPEKALAQAFEQAGDVLGLIHDFPRDASNLLVTFALPFPLVLWFRRGRPSRTRQVAGLLALATVLTLALYTPLLPEPSTKSLNGVLVHVGPLEHLGGWWLLLISYGTLLALAASLGDALDRRLRGSPPA